MTTFLTSTNPAFDISEVSVGQHFYWQIGDYQVHGQVLLLHGLFLVLLFVYLF